MLKSIIGLVDDVTEIAAAPVKIAVDLARAATKPLAEAAKETADAINDLTTDNQKERR